MIFKRMSLAERNIYIFLSEIFFFSQLLKVYTLSNCTSLSTVGIALALHAICDRANIFTVFVGMSLQSLYNISAPDWLGPLLPLMKEVSQFSFEIFAYSDKLKRLRGGESSGSEDVSQATQRR